MAIRPPVIRRVAVLIGLVYLLGAVAGTAFAVYERDGPLPTAGLLALGLAAGACYVLVNDPAPRRGRTAMLLVIVVLGLVQNVAEPYSGLPAVFVLAWIAPFVVRLPSAAAVVLAVAAGGLWTLLAGGVPFETAGGITLGVLFAGAFAVTIRQLFQVRHQTDLAAEARAGAAVLAERQRMAREMHDLLAHTLAAQIVHLEGARMLMDRGDRPDEAHRQVVGALRLARDGLQETTRALAALRGDELRVVDRLSSLVADFRARHDSRCELDADAEPAGLGSEAGWAIVRTAQEALTNVHKHADGADVVVRLTRAGRWCELEVVDTGGRQGPLAGSGAGYGLTGMRERAELLGGSLEAGAAGAGFRVRLCVPLTGLAP